MYLALLVAISRFSFREEELRITITVIVITV
jgi:hypothetical protein